MNKISDKLLSWASIVDDNTLKQAQACANMPFVPNHVALMPDAHLGIGATVGSVIPTSGAIIPAAVGVDIGCGMIAVKTTLSANVLPDGLNALLLRIEDVVPAGLGREHSRGSIKGDKWMTENRFKFSTGLSQAQKQKVVKQFGTLGSGNHFIEICLDERNDVWVVLHSGSRGIGNELARFHIEGAKNLMSKMFITLDDPDLAYFVQNTPEFDAYITDLLMCQRYAADNREMMMDEVLRILFSFCRDGSEDIRINCHHNFCQLENHMGKNLWITRKGAIKASYGDLGVIPGSMGTRSYIVEGLGNKASYNSCSHGAGRAMSRTQARKNLSVDSFKKAMGTRTWQSDRADALLDEHPDSYKNIDQVMEDQKDLVRPIHTLRQILNYKGTK